MRVFVQQEKDNDFYVNVIVMMMMMMIVLFEEKEWNEGVLDMNILWDLIKDE